MGIEADVAQVASASASHVLCPATAASSEREGGQRTARRGFLRRLQVRLSSEWGLSIHWCAYWATVPPVTIIHFGQLMHQDNCLYSKLDSSSVVPQSLKSPFALSHPDVEGSIAATRSTSLVFKLRDLSVQSSNIVARLNKRVCEEKPRSTKPSSISRPCHRLVRVHQSEQETNCTSSILPV